jgi:hypothetical protein
MNGHTLPCHFRTRSNDGAGHFHVTYRKNGI